MDSPPTRRVVLASLLLPSVLLVFVPLELYANNSAFLLFPGAVHLLFALPMVAGVALALYAGLRALPARARDHATGAVLAAGLATWTLATFYRDGGYVLLGRQFLSPPPESPPSLVYYGVALGLLGAFMALARFRPAGATRLALALLVLLAGRSAWIATFDGKRGPDLFGAADVTRFAEARTNVLVLLLDALQNDIALSLLKEDPQLAAELDGFVYYRNAMSAAPSTYGALPAIHSGATLQGLPSLSETYREGVARHSFMATLARHGYSTVVMNPIGGVCPDETAFCSSLHVTIDGYFSTALAQSLYLWDLTLYRIAPRELRHELYDDGLWLLSRLAPHARLSHHAIAALDALGRRPTLDSPVPTAKFLHLYHSHPPFTVDATCKEQQELSYAADAARAAAHCALRTVARLARGLRAQGLYDNTLIVVVSDHGLGIVTGPDGKADFDMSEAFDRTIASASAAMAVKGLGAAGPLSISDDLVSNADVKRIVCDQTAACGNEAPPPSAAKVPLRRYASYEWSHEFWLQDAIPKVTHYLVRGDHRNLWSWMPVVDPGTMGASQLRFSAEDPQGVYGPGWSVPEASGQTTWRCAIGAGAQLHLDLPPGTPSLNFYLKNNPSNTKQELTVRLNGEPVGSFLPSAAGESISLRVPATTHPRSPAVVTFSFSQSNPPPGDLRPISACFFGLKVVAG